MPETFGRHSSLDLLFGFKARRLCLHFFATTVFINPTTFDILRLIYYSASLSLSLALPPSPLCAHKQLAAAQHTSLWRWLEASLYSRARFQTVSQRRRWTGTRTVLIPRHRLTERKPSHSWIRWYMLCFSPYPSCISFTVYLKPLTQIHLRNAHKHLQTNQLCCI